MLVLIAAAIGALLAVVAIVMRVARRRAVTPQHFNDEQVQRIVERHEKRRVD